jgi:hypothetical protein
MKKSIRGENKNHEKAKSKPQITDEMEEMATFIRKKRLQNQILKKASTINQQPLNKK